MDTVGAVILAGGKSRRRGENKALLLIEGRTFLERIESQLKDFPEVLLSVAKAQDLPSPGPRLVEDVYPDRGPVGGLYSALSACRSSWLLAVSCDMPLFPKGLGEYLAGQRGECWDALVVRTRNGRLHPLCGLYHKRGLAVLERQLESGNYRMRDALAALRTREVPLEHTVYPDEAVANVNTPQEYARLKRRVQGPPVVAVCGIKNSGKTTFLCRILPLLREQGLRVAVIKHDGHDFAPDVPGTDSYRLREAGASGVAVWSGYRYALTEERRDTGWQEMVERFPQADLILLEGGKDSSYPKIELVRGAVSRAPVSDPCRLLAIATDVEMTIEGVPVCGLEDYPGAVERILEYMDQ